MMSQPNASKNTILDKDFLYKLSVGVDPAVDHLFFEELLGEGYFGEVYRSVILCPILLGYLQEELKLIKKGQNKIALKRGEGILQEGDILNHLTRVRLDMKSNAKLTNTKQTCYFVSGVLVQTIKGEYFDLIKLMGGSAYNLLPSLRENMEAQLALLKAKYINECGEEAEDDERIIQEISQLCIDNVYMLLNFTKDILKGIDQLSKHGVFHQDLWSKNK